MRYIIKRKKKRVVQGTQNNTEVYIGKCVYYHLMYFLKDTITPRTTKENVSDKSKMQLQN